MTCLDCPLFNVFRQNTLLELTSLSRDLLLNDILDEVQENLLNKNKAANQLLACEQKTSCEEDGRLCLNGGLRPRGTGS